MLPIVFLLLLVVSSCLANGAGPVGKIEIKKIDACDNSNYQLKIQFDSSAGDGKTFNIQFKTTRTINENWTFRGDVDKWTGTAWKTGVMKGDGKMCQAANEAVPALKERVFKALNVKKCELAPGSYSLKAMKFFEKDIKMKALPYGKFRITVKAWDDKKTIVACFVGEGEHSPKI